MRRKTQLIVIGSQSSSDLLSNFFAKRPRKLCTWPYLETAEDILSPSHAGFRKEHNTCDQVAALTTYIEQGFQLQLQTGSVCFLT